ncbi:MFS transporter [Plantibacter flavus]|uniref:MFS transporter n=1 Tax=Plantibacter flavus TaxID=150123 RepID=UPI003F176117
MKPPHAAAVLTALILAAGVANINLSVANVALPTIGLAFDASQDALNLVAVAYTLGLAGTVLYLGALGDRFGRKRMLLIGVAVSIPAALLAAFAPSLPVLVLARLIGGVAAGAAYPTTLSLITALWSGKARTQAIAIWSGAGAALSVMGPLSAGWILEWATWGIAFLVAIPLAVVSIVLVVAVVPSGVHESSEPVDHLGGVLSIIAVSSLAFAVHTLASPDEAGKALAFLAVAVVAGGVFAWRQLHVSEPLYDLRVAKRRVFWVAAVSGTIVFGSLTGAIYVGQLFLQNVLGYSPFEAGLSILPAALLLLASAPVSGILVERFGSRVVFLLGFGISLAGFAVMLLTWNIDTGVVPVGVAYGLIGIGVGLAGLPASRSLTGSVPVRRAGMASSTSDLQRDLGAAILQSLLGAVLTVGYTASFGRRVAEVNADQTLGLTVGPEITGQLQKSYSGAEQIAEQYPQYHDQVIGAARDSFLAGAQAAYLIGIIAMAVGALIVAIWFPRKSREDELFAQYAREDAEPPTT